MTVKRLFGTIMSIHPLFFFSVSFLLMLTKIIILLAFSIKVGVLKRSIEIALAMQQQADLKSKLSLVQFYHVCPSCLSASADMHAFHITCNRMFSWQLDFVI